MGKMRSTWMASKPITTSSVAGEAISQNFCGDGGRSARKRRPVSATPATKMYDEQLVAQQEGAGEVKNADHQARQPQVAVQRDEVVGVVVPQVERHDETGQERERTAGQLVAARAQQPPAGAEQGGVDDAQPHGDDGRREELIDPQQDDQAQHEQRRRQGAAATGCCAGRAGSPGLPPRLAELAAGRAALAAVRGVSLAGSTGRRTSGNSRRRPGVPARPPPRRRSQRMRFRQGQQFLLGESADHLLEGPFQ